MGFKMIVERFEEDTGGAQLLREQNKHTCTCTRLATLFRCN